LLLNNSLNSPAIYSAIAAFFSGLAAWTMVMIHRRNALDAAKPELVFSNWSRISRSGGEDTIRIGTLENVGKGPALHVAFYLPEFDIQKPRVGITTQHISILSPGKTSDINWDVFPMWQQATNMGEGKKIHSLKLGLYCFDTKDWRHNTLYTVTISNDKAGSLFGAEEIGDGIYGHRISTANPFWLVKLKGKALATIEKAKQFWRKTGRRK
jgi:hypothetical protein